MYRFYKFRIIAGRQQQTDLNTSYVSVLRDPPYGLGIDGQKFKYILCIGFTLASEFKA